MKMMNLKPLALKLGSALASALGTALVAGLAAPPAQAALVTADFRVNLTQVYNVQTQSYEAITPLSATGAFDVSSDAARTVTHDGNTTTTSIVLDDYEYHEDLRFESPLPTSLPYSLSGFFLTTQPFSSPSFTGFTTDSPTGFVEGVDFLAYFLGPPLDHGIASPYYSFEVSLTKTSAARNGDGSSGYEFTGDALASFLESAMLGDTVVHYSEGWSDSASVGDFPYPVGVQGQQYTDDDARLVDVKIDDVSQVVSEPGSLALSALGAAVLALVMRRRRAMMVQ
ncbi:MAG TPA: hypothetical protein VGM81_13490 [Burkholderiaceae bacterium]|jgi:hypothetical protein